MFRALALAALGYAAYRLGARILSENAPGPRLLLAPPDPGRTAADFEQAMAQAGIRKS